MPAGARTVVPPCSYGVVVVGGDVTVAPGGSANSDAGGVAE
jgi:hypothetical protein